MHIHSISWFPWQASHVAIYRYSSPATSPSNLHFSAWQEHGFSKIFCTYLCISCCLETSSVLWTTYPTRETTNSGVILYNSGIYTRFINYWYLRVYCRICYTIADNHAASWSTIHKKRWIVNTYNILTDACQFLHVLCVWLILHLNTLTDTVHRNYEAGKQLVINSINGNDSLGWVDTLTRVDLNKRFQYFPSVVQSRNACHIHNNTIGCGFYFRPYEYCMDIGGSNVTINKAWDWLVKSQYKEQRLFNQQITNVWSHEVHTQQKSCWPNDR